jgi:hypothetical protein
MIALMIVIYRSISFDRFFFKIYCFLFVFLLYSCDDNDNLKPRVVEKSLELKIENKNYKVENESIGFSENCNELFIRVQYYNSKNGNFTIEFNLTKKGIIKNIRLVDFSVNNDLFESADFNPTETLSISNFKYDEIKKNLYFEFKGELIKVDSNYSALDKNQERKQIEGNLTINNITNTICTDVNSELNFKTFNLNFSTNLLFASYDTSLTTNPYQFYFYSDNGYRIIIKSKIDLWNIAKGTYSFGLSSIEDRIDIEKYIGNVRATQLLWIREIDWKKYQASGNYTILEHQIINGKKVTKGEFNLQVFDNGILKYNITNAKFEVIGF